MTKPRRLMIITDGRPGPHLKLTEAFLRAARARQDVNVTAICDSDFRAPLPPCLELAKHLVSRSLFCLFSKEARESFTFSTSMGLRGIARRHGVPLLTPPERNINHPAFINLLKNDAEPDLAITLACSQILRPKLLECFAYAVNCHTALLPKHRGVAATHWSLYEGDATTGLTFHRLTKGIDEGEILLQCAMSITSEDRGRELASRKWSVAAQEADRVLDLMVSHSTGTPQGPGSYHSNQDLRRIRTIDDPSSFTYDELQRRSRAFVYLKMKLDGQPFNVTRIRRTRTTDSSRLAFSTRDGIRARPTRFFFLPWPLYRLCNWLHLIPDVRNPRPGPGTDIVSP